jgi:hypothetical protein
MLNTKKKMLAVGLVSIVALTWLGVFVALRFFEPSLAQKTLIITVAAVISEVALWIGAAVLGITALNRFRVSSLLRSKTD